MGLALALVAAACGGTSPGPSASSPTASGQPTRGGVLRTAISSFGFTGGFDPTDEYLGLAWDFYGAMLRNLVSYKHIGGAAGNALYPDLATSMPEISPDGLTYTFHLKSGIKFGPPVNREITSQDIAYAFERINDKNAGAEYGFYYDGVIKGMTGQVNGIKPVSGIETPDATTIIFHLTQPTGDFLYRLAMPATAPIPVEVAKCFPTGGGYGRFVISSGPYMIQGSQDLSLSQSCSQMVKNPISGFDPTKQLILVRNPNYAQSTDNLRSNYVNAIDIQVDANVSDIFNKVAAGTLDSSLADPPPTTTLTQYLTNPSKKPYLHSDSGDRTWYITMNLLTPPFDDVHVREAVNFIIDKAALQQAWGGPVFGQIATHIMPPIMLNNALTSSYDPYKTPGETGSLALAQAQMKLSKYDPKHDGKCDIASACTNIVMINRNYAPWSTMEPIVVQDLAKIGIQVVPRELETGAAYQTIDTTKNNIPIALNAGWGKDYADPFTFAQPLFGSAALIPVGNTNYSMVGVTSAIIKKQGLGVTIPKGLSVPSVDSLINQCEGQAGATRQQCWVNFDEYVMTKVVPWVPYLWATNLTITAPSLTKWVFDQFSGYISLTQVAVNNNISVSSLG